MSQVIRSLIIPLRQLPLPIRAFLLVVGIFVALKLVRPVIPGSVILLYMGFVIAGVVIHITLDDGRIRQFADFFLRPARCESPQQNGTSHQPFCPSRRFAQNFHGLLVGVFYGAAVVDELSL